MKVLYCRIIRDKRNNLPTLGDNDSLLLPVVPTSSPNRVIYHVSIKPCDGLQSSEIDLIDNQHIDRNSGGGIVTECDDGSRDEVNLEPSVTSLVSQVLRNFTKIQKRLHRSCTQLKLLQLKCDAIKVRHRRSRLNTASNYSL